MCTWYCWGAAEPVVDNLGFEAVAVPVVGVVAAAEAEEEIATGLVGSPAVVAVEEGFEAVPVILPAATVEPVIVSEKRKKEKETKRKQKEHTHTQTNKTKQNKTKNRNRKIQKVRKKGKRMGRKEKQTKEKNEIKREEKRK